MIDLVVLRPEPGASATAMAARAIGLVAHLAPLFEIVPAAWRPAEPNDHDALLLTSANAVRHAGSGLADVAALPVYAVGRATAAAAGAAGLDVVHVGDGDAAALIEAAAQAGVRRALHLAGADHRDVATGAIELTRRIVYRADARPLDAAALAPLREGAVALLHSPRAATAFVAQLNAAGIDRRHVALVAISAAAAAVTGDGWRRRSIAASPSDDAMLAAAAWLCEERRMAMGVTT